MRKAFIKALMEKAHADKNIMLLTGDLGFSVFEEFIEKYPGQYINCGVAEQNMMGVAAGLAMSGKNVFVYSIVPFATMRPLEQVRDDICFHNLDIKIIGVGGGYSYGQLGSTHHAIEDIAIMRALPNMKVFVPADPIETRVLINKIVSEKGPSYIRLGKSREQNIHRKEFNLEIGKPVTIRRGGEIVFFVAGPILKDALEAADFLKKESGMSIKVFSTPTVKPLSQSSVIKQVRGTKAVFTIEEHGLIGGLGDAVASILAESSYRGIFKKIGIHDLVTKKIGGQEYLKESMGISGKGIAKLVEKSLV